jgi:hypothetical protein
MGKSAAIGFARGWDGHEVARQAVQQALDQLGGNRPALALLFTAQEFSTAEIVNTVSRQLGNIPLWGFSTTCPLSAEGEQPRSVGVMLLSGSGYKAHVNWWPNFAQDSSAVATQFARAVRTQAGFPQGDLQGVLLAADGVNGDAGILCKSIDQMNLPVAGCLASGDYRQGRTICLGGNHAESGALSALFLGGRLRLGLGMGHGWRDTGWLWKVTRARDVWLQGLDNLAPASAYASVLGYPEKEWAFSPLSDFVRLYPLGIEVDGLDHLLLRSPLRMEVDGNLRMNTHLPEGQFAHLMTGDPDACLAAVKTATIEAQQSLGAATPVLGLLLIDQAWQALLEGRSEGLFQQLQKDLPGVPLIGGYTLGQLGWPMSGYNSSQLVNQHALLVLIGETQTE